jgi:hypothetical protein
MFAADPVATVAEELADPPAPTHVIAKAVVVASAPVDWLPLVALVPVQPPLAEQDDAFVLVQLSVDVPPLATDVGVATNVTEGGGEVPALTETVAEAVPVPPLPEQSKEKVLVEDNWPVVSVPDVG